MPDEFDKDLVAAANMRKIYSLQNKISRIEGTRKHYLSWKKCLDENPDLAFLDYLDSLKASYNEEIAYYRKKNAEL